MTLSFGDGNTIEPRSNDGVSMRHDTGTIIKTEHRSSDYYVTYVTNGGEKCVFAVDKRETLRGDFILASTGKRITVETDELNYVRNVTIEKTPVLRRSVPPPA